MTTIITKNGSGAPTAGQLTTGELAVDLTNKELYTKDSGGNVIKVGSQGGSTGTFTDLTATSSFTSPGIDDNANATAITIDASENVGIGTAAPATPLNIKAAAPNITIQDTTESFSAVDAGLVLTGSSSGAPRSNIQWRMANKGTDLTFSYAASATPAMVVDAAGNVGIGQPNPGTKLGIKTATATNETAIRLSDDLTQTLNVFVDGTATTGGIHYENPNVGYQRWSTSNIERMRLDASGNVGIGTSTPAGKQHTALATSHTWGAAWSAGTAVFGGAGSTNGALGISYNDTDGAVLGAIAPGVAWKPVALYGSEFIFGISGTENVRINASGDLGYSGKLFSSNAPGTLGGLQLYRNHANGECFLFDTTAAPYSGPLIFGTSNAERMRIDSSGNLLVGRSSTAGGATDYGAQIYNSGVIYLFANASGNDDIFRGHNSAGTNTSAIEADGNYIDLSDERVKENITDAPDALSLINSMKVRRFDWIGRDQHQTYGFVAQELNSVFEEAVKSPDDEETMWGVRHSKIIPVLTKALQEAVTRIETLEAEVAALKGE